MYNKFNYMTKKADMADKKIKRNWECFIASAIFLSIGPSKVYRAC